MMKLKIKKIIISLFVISITNGVSFAQQEPDDAITIKAIPKAIKGFPLVIKVVIKGPQKVKYLSINENGIPITVYLKSESEGKEYIIKSRRTFSYTATMSDGRQIELSDDEVDPPVEIPDGQKYTMMFDLWSLSAIRGTETTLSDVPSGKYSLFVELNSAYPLPKDVEEIKEEQNQNIRGFGGGISSKQYIRKITKSNSIDIELIEPSDKEKQFIEVIHSKFRIGGVKGGVSWVEVLRRRIVIPDDDMPKLTQISKDQISFHKLLSNVDITDDKSKNKSINYVNETSVSDFYKPERELLLLELNGKLSDECESLLKEYPNYTWNIESGHGGQDFLLFRAKTVYELMRESSPPKEPNSQNERNNNTNQQSLRGPRTLRSPTQVRNSVR